MSQPVGCPQDLLGDILELPPLPEDSTRPSSGASAQTGSASTTSSSSPGRLVGQVVRPRTDRPPPVVLAGLFGGDGAKEKFNGAIKSFNLDTGYGFISCARVQNLMGCDVFFYRDELYDIDPSKVSKGSLCTFWCKLGKNSKPQARVVRIAESSEKSPEMTGAESKTYLGKLKSFNKDSGYGFIACEETHEIYDSDVFLHHSKLMDFKVGDEVKFQITVDSKKGKPQPKAFGLEAPASARGASAELPAEVEEPHGDLQDSEEASPLADLDYRRYINSDGAVWWCCESDGDWFMENEPGDWVKYVDPSTNKHYWWNPNGRWFWEPLE